MAICFNHTTVTATPVGYGAHRQPLLTAERIPGTNILLDRLTLDPGGRIALHVGPGDIAWFQMLDGTAALDHAGGSEHLTNANVGFMPPGFSATVATGPGATLIYAVIPNASRFDATLSSAPPAFRTVDWQREPVLDSQHDARQRIYLVTPKLFGNKALKGEMIIYPPGTMAANHHHEGAEHFMYILRGEGTAWANERPFKVAAGDVVYYHDRERHYLKADDQGEMAFAEFFVPGEYRTIWVDEAQVCTWLPSGRDINGGRPVREISAHSSALVKSPADV